MKCRSLLGALLAASIFMLVVAADAQGPPAVNGPFRFDIAEAANGHRGPALEDISTTVSPGGSPTSACASTPWTRWGA
jgi:hypothetical protein